MEELLIGIQWRDRPGILSRRILMLYRYRGIRLACGIAHRDQNELVAIRHIRHTAYAEVMSRNAFRVTVVSGMRSSRSRRQRNPGGTRVTVPLSTVTA